MKKHVLLNLAMVASLLVTPAFAKTNEVSHVNDCIRYMDNHRYQFLLSLSSCQLQDKDLPDVLSYVSRRPDIKVLFLDENNISAEGAKLLANELATEFLGIDNNHIGPEGAEALAQNKSLFGISASSNFIGTKGALALAKSNRLESVTVANNDIQPAGITALANNPHIKLLGVAENTLDAASIAALVNNKNLNALDISYTNAGFNDVVALLDRPDLFDFCINGLHLGDGIASKLAQKKTIHYLDIMENDLTVVGVNALKDLIDDDFVELNISHNPIGDQGIAELAKAKTDTLPFLSIEDDNISDVGVDAFGNAPMYILDLNISHNHLSANGISALSGYSNIRYFDASYNDGDQQNVVSKQSGSAVNKTKFANIKSYCADKMNQKCLTYLQKMRKN